MSPGGGRIHPLPQQTVPLLNHPDSQSVLQLVPFAWQRASPAPTSALPQSPGKEGAEQAQVWTKPRAKRSCCDRPVQPPQTVPGAQPLSTCKDTGTATAKEQQILAPLRCASALPRPPAQGMPSRGEGAGEACAETKRAPALQSTVLHTRTPTHKGARLQEGQREGQGEESCAPHLKEEPPALAVIVVFRADGADFLIAAERVPGGQAEGGQEGT